MWWYRDRALSGHGAIVTRLASIEEMAGERENERGRDSMLISVCVSVCECV